MISEEEATKTAIDWLKKLNKENLEFKEVFFVNYDDKGFTGFSDEKVDKWIGWFEFDRTYGLVVDAVLEIDANTGEILKDTVI